MTYYYQPQIQNPGGMFQCPWPDSTTLFTHYCDGKVN